MHLTSIPAQGNREPARLATVLTMATLLAASMGYAVSAQDAYGGITRPNYPNPYQRDDGSTISSGSPAEPLRMRLQKRNGKHWELPRTRPVYGPKTTPRMHAASLSRPVGTGV
jgi:hypothetical protein